MIVSISHVRLLVNIKYMQTYFLWNTHEHFLHHNTRQINRMLLMRPKAQKYLVYLAQQTGFDSKATAKWQLIKLELGQREWKEPIKTHCCGEEWPLQAFTRSFLSFSSQTNATATSWPITSEKSLVCGCHKYALQPGRTHQNSFRTLNFRIFISFQWCGQWC